MPPSACTGLWWCVLYYTAIGRSDVLGAAANASRGCLLAATVVLDVALAAVAPRR